MKIRNNLFLIAALIFTAFVLVTCSDGLDNQGSININFDNSGARYAGAENDATMLYTITLTSPGKTAITRTTNTSISIPVSEGAWDIKVDAEGRRVRGEGNATVAVTAGRPAFAKIGMRVTGTRVYDFDDLYNDFNDKDLPQQFSIAIVSSFNASSSRSIVLNTGKIITLWAEEMAGVTIDRKNNDGIKNTVFLIENGTLTLDGRKGGTITIKGNGQNSDCERALINVEGNSTLTINEGVTLTNNHTTNFGGGVYIKDYGKFYMNGGTISGNKADDDGGGVFVKDYGKFYMNEGTISGNKADDKGGGVYVEGQGTFTKTGGIIYGSEEGVDSKNVNLASQSNASNGDAVYNKNISYNNTQ